MITTTEKREVFSTGQTKEMKIKANGKAFKIIASSLYKNLPAAILREIGQNSFDAHTKANKKDIPFEVHLPTQFNPILKFIDEGCGMAPEFIEDNESGYLACFHSSKDENDEEIGGFGIGKLVGLALVDSYVIVSRWNKKEYTYNVFLGGNEVPQLIKISEEKTDKSNGVAIELAIPNEKIHEFKNSLQKIYQFFPTPPVIKENDNVISIKTVGNAKFKGQDWLIPDYNSGYFSTDGYKSPIVHVGCYGYEIPEISDLTNNQRNLLKTGIVLKFQISEITCNASRESIQLDNKTVSIIKDRLNNIIIDLFSNIENEIKSAKDLIEAKLIWAKWNKSPEIAEIRSLFQSFKFKWNNEEICNDFVNFKEIEKDNVNFGYYRFSTYKSKRITTLQCNQIQIAEDTRLIYNDFPSSGKARIKGLFFDKNGNDKSHDKTYYIEGTQQNIDEFLKKYQISEINLIKLSNCLKWINPNPTEYTGDEKSKAKAFVFNGGRSYDAKNNWDVVDIDIRKDKGIFVNLDRYEIFDGSNGYNCATLIDIINCAKKLNINIDKIYGFKNSYVEKTLSKHKNWVNLATFLKEKLLLITIEDLNYEQSVFNELLRENFENPPDCQQFNKDGPAYKLFSRYERVENLKYYFDRLIQKYNIQIDFNETELKMEFNKLFENFEKSYPMLKFVDKNWKEEYSDYVNLMDKP